ncbi:MAG: hypothetical protein IPL41_13225 [Micropruina sp.]|nr:hypothetical protein [Micropruina sp.]
MTWQWLAPLMVAAALAALSPRMLRALPPPSDEPLSRPYDALATPGFALVSFVLIAVAGTVVLALAPAYTWAWLGLGTVGVLAALVDARTGYLPAVLMRIGWLLTAAGLVTTAAISGDWQVLIRGAGGALAAGALFWVFHRFGGGFGFGDVRLAPIIAAPAAAQSWTMLAGALLLGGLLGVAWGLVWQALGRGRSFPYGPALVAGPYLALIATAALPP